MGADGRTLPLGSADLQLRELRGALDRGEPLLAVHYGCEDLYKSKRRPAAVACIALADIDEGSSDAFSLLVRLLHWNMNNAAYGFKALAKRYRYLTGKRPPYQPPEGRTYDVDNLIAHQFGEHYAPHPKLANCAALNGISKRFFLEGKDEAERFEEGDFERIRASVSEKARIIGELFRKLARGVLVTQSGVGSVPFAGKDLDAVRTILALGDRMLDVQRALAVRRKNRPPIDFEDEYDDQYLLGALLRVFFGDVRGETVAAEYAGSSSRIDFTIPEFHLGLELKHTRPTMSDGDLGDELIIDRDRYSRSGEVNHLICLVFDRDGHLRNPRALEKDLSREASMEGLAVTVRIFDR